MTGARRRWTGSVLVTAALIPSLAGCAGTRPDDLGVREDGRLAPCPRTPNGVSSDADPADEEHWVAPFVLAVEPARAWETVRKAVADDLSRTTIVTATDDYLHAECRSLIFRFVDDLELHLRAEDGVVAVRSAARKGSRDFGVNRGRVEELRAALVERGAVRPAVTQPEGE